MSASDFVRQLQRAVEDEQAEPVNVEEYSDLVDTSWHWVGPAWTLPPTSESTGGTGRVIGFGSEFGPITETMIRNSLDRNGHSILADVLRDEAVQIRLFGTVCARPGPWPEDVVPFEVGSVLYIEACAAERERAVKISDPDKRFKAMQAVRSKYGSSAYFSGSSQQTSTAYDGGDGRAALLQPDH